MLFGTPFLFHRTVPKEVFFLRPVSLQKPRSKSVEIWPNFGEQGTIGKNLRSRQKEQ